MAKASTKHFNQKRIAMPSFAGGLNLTQPPETIRDDQLTDAKNAEYNHVSGALRSVPGINIRADYGEDDAIYGDTTPINNDSTSIYTWNLTVTSVYYDSLHDTYLFTNEEHKLYKTDLIAVTLIDTLTGTEKPFYCLFGNYVLIASGGHLQYYDGTTLTTIDSSPLCTFVMDFFGRVLVAGYDDRIDESGIGDCTNWTNNTSDPSSAQFINIGYKDSGKITAIRMFGSDLIIAKDSGRLYRRTGQYPNWVVTELSRKADCINRHCMLTIGNNAFFFGKTGFKSLETVTDYGDIKQNDAGEAINSVLSVDSTAAMWLVEPKKQIWIRSNNGTKVYIYHYATGAFTYRNFKHIVTDVITVGNDIFVAYGNKIGRLDETVAHDDGMQIVTIIKSKRYLPEKLYTILKYTRFQCENLVPGSALLEVGETKIGVIINSSSQPVFGNTAPVYGNTTPVKGSSFTNVNEYGGGSNDAMQITLTVMEGALELRDLYTEIAEV